MEHITHNSDSIGGTLITMLLLAITFTDIELAAKIVASIATTIAAIVTIYYTIKKNKSK